MLGPYPQCLKMNWKVQVNVYGGLEGEEKSLEGNPSACLGESVCASPAALQAPTGTFIALATGLGPVRCPEPLTPLAPLWGGSGYPVTWAGVGGTCTPGALGARWAEVEVHPSQLPGLGNECLDPFHFLLLLLQLLRTQGSVRLQVNVPLRDEDFVWGGELWRDQGHRLHSSQGFCP